MAIKYIKKGIASVLLVLLVFLLSGLLLTVGTANAISTGGGGISSSGFFYLNGTAIQPRSTSWSIGSLSTPVTLGVFTTLRASTTFSDLLTFTSMGGDTDGGGYNFSNLGIVTGTNFIGTSTSATNYFLGDTGIGTTSPISELTVDGDITGNVYYGEMYMMNNATATDLVTQNVYKTIGEVGGAVMLQGLMNGMTFSNPTTTVSNRGIYRVVTTASFSNGGSNDEYDLAVAVDGADQARCHIRRKIGAAGDVGAVATSCLLDLDAGAEITAVIETKEAGINDITVGDINVSLEYIGL